MDPVNAPGQKYPFLMTGPLDSGIGDLPVQRLAPTGFRSHWLPTREELAVLNAGGFVELEVLSLDHPPVGLGVLERGTSSEVFPIDDRADFVQRVGWEPLSTIKRTPRTMWGATIVTDEPHDWTPEQLQTFAMMGGKHERQSTVILPYVLGEDDVAPTTRS